MRTGLSQAYAHGGAATADEDAIGYANTGGLTPTLISAVIGATLLAADTAVDEVDTLVAGTGNVQLPNCARVICSTTNISADDMLGAGLILAVSTNATGVLLCLTQTVTATPLTLLWLVVVVTLLATLSLLTVSLGPL